MSHSQSFSDEVLELAEEFLARYRQGERPPLCEYTDRHPHLAEQIREVFPAMALMENIAIDESQPAMTGDRRESVEPALQQLGDYRIIREVGRGGMGIVYEAEQVSLGRHVALKVLPRQMLLDGKQKRRFEREAKAAARLHHTNIVPVFGVGEHEGMHYYVMQFIQGLGLDQVLTELRQMHGDNRATAVMPVASQKPGAASRGETAAAEMARSLMTGAFERTVLGPDEPQPTAEEINVAQAPDPANPGREAGGFSTRPAYAGLQPAPVGSSSRNKAVSDSSSGSFSGSITLPGQSASQSTARVRKATYWQSVAQIGTQVASALQYAHDQGILHRDIKPSNLLLDLRGTVWIADFGLAKANDQQEITHTGDILGTLRYMPPEAFEGKGDSRSDLYSLGLTLYELLALKPAFDDKDRNKLIQRVTTAEAPRLESLNPAIPRDLATIVHKAIDREPGHRYQSAGALAEDLQRFIDDEPIVARPLSYLERFVRWSRRNRALAVATAITVVVLALVSVGSLVAASYLEAVNTRLVATVQSLERQRYFNDLNLARQLWDENNSAAAKELLKKHCPTTDDQRDRIFEWNFVRRYLDGDSQAFSIDDAFGAGVCFLADETQILASFNRLQRNTVGFSRLDDVILRCWDLPSGRLLELPTPLSENLTGALVASGDGRRVAATQNRVGVTIWDLETRTDRELAMPSGMTIDRIALSGNGRRLVTLEAAETPDDLSAGRPCRLQVWDVETDALTLTVDVLPHSLFAVSDDGSKVGVLGGTGALRLIDIENGANSGTIDCDRVMTSLTFSPDGSLLAGSGTEGMMLWRTDSRDVVQVIRSWKAFGYSLAFSPDSSRFAVGTGEGTVELWNTATWNHEKTLKGHTGFVRTVRFNSLSNQIASAAFDGIRIWNIETNETPVTNKFRGSGDFPNFSPDGRMIVSGVWSRLNPLYRSQNIQVWSADRGDALFEPVQFSSPVCAALWTTAGDRLYVADSSGSVHVVESTTGRILRNYTVRSRGLYPMALCERRGLLACGCLDGAVELFTTDDGSLVHLLQGPFQTPLDIAFAPDGRSVAAADRLGNIHLWDTATAERLRGAQWSERQITTIRFSPDGAKLLLAGNKSTSVQGEIQIYHAATLSELHCYTAHTWFVTDAQFSPDGRRVATISVDRNLKLWDVESGLQAFSIQVTNQPLFAVRWRDDGKQLAVVDANFRVRLLDGWSYAQK